MLTPAVADLVSYFYPFGNTPALSLTRNIPPERQADVLLLGCGDVRNILFTAYAESDHKRKIDITCCDIQCEIIARNIFLLSCVIDDTAEAKKKSIWNTYYNFYLDEESLKLLDDQSTKLVALADSLVNWNGSKYGKCLRFCDSVTLFKVKEIWESYRTSKLNQQERKKLNEKLKANLKKAADTRAETLGSVTVMTGIRSAAPAGITMPLEFSRLNQNYWDNGVAGQKQPGTSILNPMFITEGTLHYGLDPLLGFHLATAFTPLTAQSPLKLGSPPGSKIIEAAQVQFQAWTKAYRRGVHNMTLRFFNGDAIAFCRTLQHFNSQRSERMAHYYRAPNQPVPLLLDGDDYGLNGAAPLSFSVIDTSNIVDHLGPLNVLMATSPLLSDETYSTLTTESLVKRESTHAAALNGLLCGDFPTVSILLGLFPLEYWTKTTAISTIADVMLDAVMSQVNKDKTTGNNGQMHFRINWKRTLSSRTSVAIIPLHFDPTDLAHILFTVYIQMFQHEDAGNMLSMMGNQQALLRSLQKNSMPRYHRGNFVSFLGLTKCRVSGDWDKSMQQLVELINRDTRLMLGTNYFQELFLQMHIQGVFSVDSLKDVHSVASLMPPNQIRDTASGKLHAWNNIPSHVCITLQVPRKKLEVLTSRVLSKTGSHVVQCVVSALSGRWQNFFSAIQFSFGKLTSFGQCNSNDYNICIKQDEQGWKGTSPLFVSFLSPTWPFLYDDKNPFVAFGVQTTPQSIKVFGGDLGISLKVFETCLTDEKNVFISQGWPNLGSMAFAPSFVNSCPGDLASDEKFKTSITATVDRQASKIVSLTGRADFVSADINILLKDGCLVDIEQDSPCRITQIIGGTYRIPLTFPAPVIKATAKTRIARKSAYVEVIAPILSRTDHDSFPTFMYPLLLDKKLPVLWNLHRLGLDDLPIIDLTKEDELKWVHTHLSMMFSAREKILRESSMLPGAPRAMDVRANFKHGLFSMFLGFTGFHDGNKRMPQSRVYGINDPNNGGVHILVFISCLRLDGASGTIVLEAAVIPLTDQLVPQMQPFLKAIMNAGKMRVINVDDDEMKLWKTVLPAIVERCRTWSHRPTCEYGLKGQIPLSLKFGEPSLCSCGNGTLSTNFITNVPKWNTVARYAVKAALSPSFSVPIVEAQVGETLFKDMKMPAISNNNDPGRAPTLIKAFGTLEGGKNGNENTDALQKAMGVSKTIGGGGMDEMNASTKGMEALIRGEDIGCKKCGKENTSNGTALLKCSRCQTVRYCSAVCQKADWKEHKKQCSK